MILASEEFVPKLSGTSQKIKISFLFLLKSQILEANKRLGFRLLIQFFLKPLSYVYVCICVCMYMYVYVYMYIHINVYIHVYIDSELSIF